jgi:hypothetical protein
LMDKPTEVFRCFDGQRRSIVRLCADTREGVNLIVAPIRTSAKVLGGRMLDDPTQDDDCGAPIGKGLSSLWL